MVAVRSTGKSSAVRQSPGQVEKTCEGCKQAFWRYPNGTRGRYCSKACHNANNPGNPPAVRTDPMVCNTCGVSKPLADFSIQAGNSYRPSLKCDGCRRKPTQEQKRRSHLWIKFKITLEEWIAIYKAQRGTCPVCTRALPSLDELIRPMARTDAWSTRNWNTDHSHVTRMVRGITCRKCNVGLGSFLDDPVALRRAADYAEFHANATEHVTPEQAASFVQNSGQTSPSKSGA